MLAATTFGLLLICPLWLAESLSVPIKTCRQTHGGGPPFVHRIPPRPSVEAKSNDVRVRKLRSQTVLHATKGDLRGSGEGLFAALHATASSDAAPRPRHSFGSAAFSAAAAIGGLSTFAGRALAETGQAEVEVADLPPPYVPVAFAVLILGGVGLLTGSLGDVISDEASLGNLSGAKAKKEMERSRSSYFKK